jgi:hypothetical protein
LGSVDKEAAAPASKTEVWTLKIQYQDHSGFLFCSRLLGSQTAGRIATSL